MDEDEILKLVNHARNEMRVFEAVSLETAGHLVAAIEHQRVMYDGMVKAWEKQRAENDVHYADYEIYLGMMVECMHNPTPTGCLAAFTKAYQKALQLSAGRNQS